MVGARAVVGGGTTVLPRSVWFCSSLSSHLDVCNVFRRVFDKCGDGCNCAVSNVSVGASLSLTRVVAVLSHVAGVAHV